MEKLSRDVFSELPPTLIVEGVPRRDQKDEGDI